jgi:hypothetical protein
MTSESTTITLQVEPGGPGGSDLQLRVSPEYEAELTELLQGAGIYAGSAAEFSQTVTVLSILLVAIGPGGVVSSLSGVLKTFLTRHSSKKISFGSHGDLKSIEGYSAEDVGRVIESAVKVQEKWDQQWREQRAQTTDRKNKQLPRG